MGSVPTAGQQGSGQQGSGTFCWRAAGLPAWGRPRPARARFSEGVWHPALAGKSVWQLGWHPLLEVYGTLYWTAWIDRADRRRGNANARDANPVRMAGARPRPAPSAFRKVSGPLYWARRAGHPCPCASRRPSRRGPASSRAGAHSATPTTYHQASQSFRRGMVAAVFPRGAFRPPCPAR